MKQHLCRVVDTRILWADVQWFAFDTPELAMRPGQFALVRDPVSYDPYLRRTAWFYHGAEARVELTMRADDPLVRRTHVGDALDLLAPLGRPIEFASTAQHLLLLGASHRVAPLIAVAAHAVAQNRAVTLSMSGEAFPAHLLPPEVEYRSEETPSAELFAWADAIVASGPEDGYRRIAEMARATRYRLEPGFLRVLVDIPMPCGTGACCACAVPLGGQSVRWACTDGPVFDWLELERAR